MAGQSEETLNLKLKVWRQKGPDKTGSFMDYEAKGVSVNMSFLEMMDVMNENLVKRGDVPVEFDHDCREGICGTCSLVINGNAHGPQKATTSCQLHMRSFEDGDTIYIEPFRAKAFPVIKDLVVDRSCLDRVIQAGGFVSVNTGNAQDANGLLIGKEKADQAFEAAECIGCGACVASCKNASASLFVAAKVAHFSLLPQGQPEKIRRTTNMVAQMDKEGFGACTNTGSCSAACPKEISLENIAILNREYLFSSIKRRG